ncbi:MAG: hypothetical protein WC707_00600 [Candidatus Babeliaceae bacterium]|jgi:hypothetical protein
MKIGSFVKLLVYIGVIVGIFSLGYRLLRNKHQKTSQKISLGCKVFSKVESIECFGKDVVSQGYKPLHISISNTTQRYLKFAQNDISLKTVPAEIVARSVYSSTAKRILGWGIACLFFPILFIPAIITSVSSYCANDALTNTFIAKSATDRIIAPGSHYDGIIFVPTDDYSNRFTIMLSDKDSSEKIACNVDMVCGFSHKLYKI